MHLPLQSAAEITGNMQLLIAAIYAFVKEALAKFPTK